MGGRPAEQASVLPLDNIGVVEAPNAAGVRASRPWTSFLIGGATGFAILVITQALSETQIAFGRFALSGNGALAMPFVGFPLAVYVGWTWLADRHPEGRELALHLGAYSIGLVFGAWVLGLLFALPVVLVTGAIVSTWLRGGAARKSDTLLWIMFGATVVLSALPALSLFGVALLPASLILLARSRGRTGRIALGALLVVITIVFVFGVPQLLAGPRAG
jgi:hypothetical protein